MQFKISINIGGELNINILSAFILSWA